MGARLRLKWQSITRPVFTARVMLYFVQSAAWWQRIKQHPVATVLISLSALLVVLVLLGGYKFNWDWTGFSGSNKSGKTLWDWMQLLFIPVVLAAAGFWFNDRERKIEQQRVEADREISFDNQREAALKEYIDKLSELLLHENLCKSEPESETRKVARVGTLTVLPRLDSRRKRSVLQFLYEASLINKNTPIVDLQGVDFTDAFMEHIDLHGAMLYKVNLSGARLRGANLSEADLSDASLGVNYTILSVDKDGEPDQVKTDRTYLGGANLSRAILRNTDLYGAYLNCANLSKAVLDGTDLSNSNLGEADLNEASLTGANLSNANLKGTKVSPEQLDKAKSLKGATMPDGSIHP
jgi:uncharacterized protein YjbI with pentapeptide repeats